MFEANIPLKEQNNVMASFWTMMSMLETQADNDNSTLDKHFVEGYFRQWNLIMKDNKQPVWQRRAVK